MKNRSEIFKLAVAKKLKLKPLVKGEPGSPGVPGEKGDTPKIDYDKLDQVIKEEVAQIPRPSDGQVGQRGLQGKPGTVWYAGDAPGDEGNEGDFYLAVPTGDLFQKIDGRWVSIGSLRGQAGVGAAGDKGDTGAQGIQGFAGADGQGVPTGGTTGQVLAKNSNTNYDTKWSAAGAGGAWGAITGTLSDQTDLQTALDAKQTLDSDLTAIAALDSSTSGAIASDGAGWIKKTYAQFKTALSLVKGDVGLGNADNTSDANKPVSTAQQTALNLKANLASPTFTGTVTVPTPSNDTDASTKAYVDAVAQGLSVKQSCQLATDAALPLNTYLAGVITITATGVLTVDGTTVALNDRLLVKDEGTQPNNGIYLCTTAGAVGVAAVLTRATDSNTGAKILGGFTFVEKGTANADSGFVNTNTSAPTIGTTAITYTQFSGAGEITAGAALTKTGNTLDVGVDGSTIEVNSDALRLKDGGTTLAKLANMATASVYYRKTASSGAPEVQSLATLKTDLGLTGTNSGDQTLPIDSTITTTDITTNDASTTKHGWLLKATAPSANQLNLVGIANGETVYANKTVLDGTSPSTQAYGDAASAGTSLVAAHVDHKHAMPATTKDKTAITGVLKGDGATVSAASDGTDYFSSSRAIPAVNDIFGIFNMSAGIQSQVTVAGTYYYITNSALTMPASSKTGGGMSTSTCMVWRFKQSKNNVGTAAYNIRILRGTNGSIADTADVTQSIGTATAVVDKADIVVVLKVTATGATGSYDWGIYVDHKAATATGFGTTDATPYFNGSVSSVAMNTASLIFGIAFSNTTGTPTILTGGVVAQCYNMS